MTHLGRIRQAYGLVLLGVLCLVSAAHAKTINVPADYATIQAAIDAALKWDTVVVAPGTYKECIDFKGKAITVRSTNPTDKSVVAATIIDGDQKGSVVTFKSGEGTKSVLKGFTITNGRGAPAGSKWPKGGGVYCNAASPAIALNVITGNTADVGGGVCCERGSSPDITGNSISNNEATDSGGGLACLSGSAPAVARNTISANNADWLGGGLLCKYSSPTLTGNTVSDCSAQQGGGMSCVVSSAVISSNTFIRNIASGVGGGIHCSIASPTLSRNTITGNRAHTGGGVSCNDGSETLLDSNRITGNAVDGDGGGVYCEYSSPRLVTNTISGNSGWSGSGVCCRFESSPTLTRNVITLNGTSGGGGIGGGLFCQTSCSPVLSGNLIDGNAAISGGAVTCIGSSPTFVGDTLSGNTATGSGGAVFCSDWSSPTFTSCTMTRNAASSGGGIFCEVGSQPVLHNTIVALSTRGGGLYVDVDDYPYNPAAPTVTYCDFYNNTGGNYVNWPVQTGKNGNISRKPLFTNPAKGDYHLKSKGGRWSRATKTWVVDAVHSPCIDAGDPASDFRLEPAPNGGRINMGADGNTAEASKSAPTGAPGALMVSASCAPAGSGAQVSLNLSAAAQVQVTVTNVAGRTIAVLPSADLPQGVSTLLWKGNSTSGSHVPAGRYLVRVTARTTDGAQASVLGSLSL